MAVLVLLRVGTAGVCAILARAVLGCTLIGLLLIEGVCVFWVAVVVPSSGCRQECSKDCYNKCGPLLPG